MTLITAELLFLKKYTTDIHGLSQVYLEPIQAVRLSRRNGWMERRHDKATGEQRKTKYVTDPSHSCNFFLVFFSECSHS